MNVRELYSFVSKGKFEPFYSSKYCLRYISFLFTWICIKLNIRSNTVTIISFVLAIVGAYLQVYNESNILLISIILLILYNILDHSDGELARYEKLELGIKKGPEGPFLDTIVHYIFTPIFFFAIGYNMYSNTGYVLSLWIGIIISIWLSSYSQAAAMRVLMDVLVRDNKPISIVDEIWQHDKVISSDSITIRQIIRKVLREIFSTQGQILVVSGAVIFDSLYFVDFKLRWIVFILFGIVSIVGIPRSINLFFLKLKKIGKIKIES